jgi:GGDEF domain-containing protein
MELVPFAGEGEHASHWVVVGRDITERRNAADAIHRLAFYDVLTGLPNRRLLMERLDAMVARAHGRRGLGAVLYVDLDNFKNVNDARGHATGDALLVHAAQRLTGAVRQRDTVARIGGDEFVVLLDGLEPMPRAPPARRGGGGQDPRALAEPSRSTASPITPRPASASRCRCAPADRARPAARGRHRDVPRQGRAGRNGVALFETAMLADAQRKLTLERDLAQALENGELAMHLQLQVDHDGRRWAPNC